VIVPVASLPPFTWPSVDGSETFHYCNSLHLSCSFKHVFFLALANAVRLLFELMVACASLLVFPGLFCWGPPRSSLVRRLSSRIFFPRLFWRQTLLPRTRCFSYRSLAFCPPFGMSGLSFVAAGFQALSRASLSDSGPHSDCPSPLCHGRPVPA